MNAMRDGYEAMLVSVDAIEKFKHERLSTRRGVVHAVGGITQLFVGMRHQRRGNLAFPARSRYKTASEVIFTSFVVLTFCV